MTDEGSLRKSPISNGIQVNVDLMVETLQGGTIILIGFEEGAIAHLPCARACAHACSCRPATTPRAHRGGLAAPPLRPTSCTPQSPQPAVFVCAQAGPRMRTSRGRHPERQPTSVNSNWSRGPPWRRNRRRPIHADQHTAASSPGRPNPRRRREGKGMNGDPPDLRPDEGAQRARDGYPPRTRPDRHRGGGDAASGEGDRAAAPDGEQQAGTHHQHPEEGDGGDRQGRPPR